MSGLPMWGTLALAGESERDLVAFVRSVRERAGLLADCDVVVATIEGAPDLAAATRSALEHLGARFVPVAVRREVRRVPLAAKAPVVAQLEEVAGERALIFCDCDTLILREPRALADLASRAESSIGVRPVHHRLIGSRWGEAPDAFWSAVWAHCGVAPARIAAAGPMASSVGELLAPYYTAGFLVLDGRARVGARWADSLAESLTSAFFADWIERSELHAVFLHQAILTGVILAQMENEAVVEFPPVYNYPLHLHAQIATRFRASSIDDLVHVRTEDLMRTGRWREIAWERAPSAELGAWLERSFT